MNRKAFFLGPAAVVFAMLQALSAAEAAQSEPQPASVTRRVSRAVSHSISYPLRDIRPSLPVPGGPRVIPNKFNIFADQKPVATVADPLLQALADLTSYAPTPNPSFTFEGTTDEDNAEVVGFRVVPPDTEGDAGIDYYVQMNNLVFEVFDKEGNSVGGPFANNSLWLDFGGICETNNDGDPVVLFDHQAKRWVFSQFAIGSDGHQCIAVSTTSDPLGSYYLYDFLVSPGRMNDYPKIGLWTDGYYMSANEFTCTASTCTYRGPIAVVFERDKMLQGQSAQMVKFSLPSTTFGLQPSHWNGLTPPPSGAPNEFLMTFDDEIFGGGTGPDGYRLWELAVDWATPGNSTFTSLGQIDAPEFDAELCGFDACVPQPSPGEPLDTLSQFTMYRAQYRHFDAHETIVFNHTVDVGSNRAGIRWAELRNTGGGWFLHQTGTFAPNDGLHRWMGSIAMDASGNIALGYSVSNASTFPSIRYTSRSAADPPGTMPGGEIECFAGTGAQTGSYNRWGDYSTMSVDPGDDCTFWYTTEYYETTGSYDFKTRICIFTLPDCEGEPQDQPPSVSIVEPGDGVRISGTVNVTANASDDNGVDQVQFLVDGLSIGVDTDGANGWSVAWNTETGSDGNHRVEVIATDTADQTASDSVSVIVDNTPPTVTITKPTSGSVVSGTVDVTAQASDATSPVSRVEFFADGSSIGLDTDGFNGWSIAWQTTEVNDGEHSLTAKATDSVGNTATSATVTVTVKNQAVETLHIGDLDGSRTDYWLFWNAYVTITVHDDAENPVADATVSGAWNTGLLGGGACTTNATGQCSLTRSMIFTSSVTFTVNNVSHAALTYAPADNHDPDADSNGTTIQINRK